MSQESDSQFPKASFCSLPSQALAVPFKFQAQATLLLQEYQEVNQLNPRK